MPETETTSEKLLVGPLAFPFFPMRPTTGTPFTPKNYANVLSAVKNYHWQPKLNGDRVCAGVLDGKVYVQNRHGSFFKHPIHNLDKYLKLPSGTVLDGEVKDKEFLPFEALSYGTENFMKACPSERAKNAKIITEVVGVDWIFEVPTQDWILEQITIAAQSRLRHQNPKWEGIVAKLKGSPYVPLGAETQTSRSWFKCKWCC